MNVEPGAVLAGKYTVTRLLGEGGMGTVFEAYHAGLGTHVALKVLRDEAMRDRDAVARFAREAKASAVLRGPHIARVFDVGELEDGRPFIVMEMLQGHDLETELSRRGKLPLAEAAHYVIEAAEALAEAHEIGIVHRDLKPANLFLSRAGNKRLLKILDFGISRFETAGESRVTQTQTAFGTPLYMAPEAVRSAKHTDSRADIWALGVILYELVSGTLPFLGETPTAVAVSVSVDTFKPLSEVCRDVPPEIDAVLSRALAKDPAHRFQTVGDLVEALKPFTEQQPLSLRASGRLSLPIVRPEQSVLARTSEADGVAVQAAGSPPRGLLWLGVGVGAALLGVGALVWVLMQSDPSHAGAGSAPASSTATAEANASVAVRPLEPTATPVTTASSESSAAPTATGEARAPSTTEPSSASAVVKPPVDEPTAIPTFGAPTTAPTQAPAGTATSKPVPTSTTGPKGNPFTL